jgi:hypothetical protein
MPGLGFLAKHPSRTSTMRPSVTQPGAAPLAFLLTLALAGLTLFLTLWPATARAAGRASVTLAATPDIIYADGKSTTVVTATVRDGGGSLVANNTPVRFTTTLGTLTGDTASTTSGVARISLTSATSPGTATITAVAFGATADGSSAGATTVEFTEDRESLFAKDARWIRLDCPQYLIYSADSRIVEAQGKNGSAHFSYKALDIQADALQVDLQTRLVLAHHATLQRGRHVLRVAELRYDLLNGAGTAVLAGEAQSVTVTGSDLETAPQPLDPAQLPLVSNPYRFVDLADSRVVVSARAITADPGDQIQFRRATIYSDGKKLLSVAYHVMPMSTDQIFGQQLIGFGSEGVFLNIPYYYNVTPQSKGTIYLRNAAVSGANIANGLSSGTSFFTGQSARHGLALDLEQTYQVGRSGSGQFLVNGITRSEWGAQWSHTQRIDEATTGYLFVDYPEHRSLYASSNVSRQFSGFSLNVNASGSRDPGIDGYAAKSYSLSTYLQTNPKRLGRSIFNYSTDFTVQQGQLVETAPDTGTVTTPISNRSVDMRLFTAPLQLDKRTQLTDSLTVGQVWGGRSSHLAPIVSASLGLTRTFRQSDVLTLNYTYRYDPLLSQLGSPSSSLNPLEALLRSSTQQRLTATYLTTPLPRLTVSFSGGYGLPLGDRSLFGAARYRINNDWGIGIATSYEQYVVDSYRDFEYSVSRKVFGRDLAFYYSTKTKKLRFDFAGSGWR